MSSEELVNAYVDGRISRRTLIRRLVAAGVSMGAAVSYAHLLAPRAGAASPSGYPPEYPLVHLKIRSTDLHEVVKEGRLKVLVRVIKHPGKGDLPAVLRLVVTTHQNGQDVHLGRRIVRFSKPGRRLVGIDLDVDPLRHRDQARVKVAAISKEGTAWDPTDPTVAEVTGTLK